jgi:hypothetical protein
LINASALTTFIDQCNIYFPFKHIGSSMSIKEREVWLHKMAELMRPRFEAMGFPLPPFRVSIGFTSGGKKSRANAEVWSSSASGDGHHQIFIRPDYDEPVQVTALLFHELTHTAVGFAQGHSGSFAKVMLAFGMSRPMTTSTPGPAFAEYVAPFIEQLGPLPHAKLQFGASFGEFIGGYKVRARKKEAASGNEDGDGIFTTAPPKQTTRLLKVECGDCGYTARVTQKWLDIGSPHCPTHGAMKLEEAAS